MANRKKDLPFHLLRYFSLISLICMSLTSAGLWYWFEKHFSGNLINTEEQNNISLAKTLSQSIWPEYKAFLSTASTLQKSALKQHPTTKKLNKAIATAIKGTGVVMIKIYDLKGLTIYSTDFAQIGTSKQGVESFETAKKGVPVSKFAFRDKSYANNELLENHNMLSSYIPIKHDPDNRIEGVFEIYRDVSGMLENIRRTHMAIFFTILSAIGLLFILLFFVVHHADKVIRTYYKIQQSNAEKIEHQAWHDALTGLPNRILFLDRLEHAMAHAQTENHLIALMFIDLDRFKKVNDSLGHDKGDQVLIKVAKRLRNCSRPSDTVARLSGDEFVVIVESLKTVDLAITFAERIIKSLEKPISFGDHKIICTSSIGVAIYPFEDDTASSLIQKADAAMYYAKQRGRNNFHLYTPSINHVATPHQELEQDLLHALEKKQFEIFLQPKINLNSWRIQGVEALLRWRHPKHGVIDPETFLPILEETGLILEIGKWALDEACRLNKKWHDSGLPPIRIAVNISNLQLSQIDFSATVFQCLKRSGLAPDLLELELTESGLVSDFDINVIKLNKLRSKGIAITLDDFGMGSLSLNYLSKLPIDSVKIDKEFVHQVTHSREHRAIVTALLSYAHDMNLEVVAEGVESAEQLLFFNAMHCTAAQGFLLSHPQPIDKFEELYLSGPSFDHLINKVRQLWNK